MAAPAGFPITFVGKVTPAGWRTQECVEVGTTIKDPFVDYAAVAKGFGVYGEGPINDPKDLGPALKRAIAVVKSGQPALLDVVMDQR